MNEYIPTIFPRLITLTVKGKEYIAGVRHQTAFFLTELEELGQEAVGFIHLRTVVKNFEGYKAKGTVKYCPIKNGLSDADKAEVIGMIVKHQSINMIDSSYRALI